MFGSQLASLPAAYARIGTYRGALIRLFCRDTDITLLRITIEMNAIRVEFGDYARGEGTGAPIGRERRRNRRDVTRRARGVTFTDSLDDTWYTITLRTDITSINPPIGRWKTLGVFRPIVNGIQFCVHFENQMS